MTGMRRDTPRRVTPERMAFYKRRAKQLRDEAYVNAARIVATTKKVVRLR